MNSRLTTSFETEKKIIELQRLLKLSTKAAVMRIAIGISLRVKPDPKKEFSESNNDHGGANYQRETIVGGEDELYKALIIEHAHRGIDEKEYFPELIGAHIARGVNILYDEYQLKGNYDRVLDSILAMAG